MTLLIYAADSDVRSRLMRRLSRRSRRLVGVGTEPDAARQWMRTYFSAILVARGRGEAGSGSDVTLCRRLRAAFGRHRPPVLFVLPGADADEVRAGLAAGADDVATSDDSDALEARLAVIEAQARETVPLSLLSALASGVAHEVRNPLNGACLHVEVAERASSAGEREEVRSALSAVLRDLARIENLADAFVSYAEARSSFACIDVVATTRRALARVALESSSARVHAALPPGPVYALHDVERLSIAICQLLRNALNAAGPGGEVIASLRAERKDVQILVEDTGPGPRPGLDVFAPFATTEPPHLGLGLPTAQRIAVEHGGYLSLSRQDGKTAAALVLPILVGVGEARSAAEASQVAR
jgi:signal transduction histidine kinase